MFMGTREKRLRERIDQLLDDRERLTTFLRISEEEQDRLSANCAALRHRVKDLERSRDMWRARVREDTRKTLEVIDARRRRKRTAA